jgi:transcriptional regulator with XRE-family HTH domain
MEVNAQVIKENRTSRAFTQQHLADACNVSLRTIQRVERYGVASSETLMSLSAVFGIENSELQNVKPKVNAESTEEPVMAKQINITIIMMASTFGALFGSVLTYFLTR